MLKVRTDVFRRLFEDGNGGVSEEVRDDKSSEVVESVSCVWGGRIELGEESQHVRVISGLVELQKTREVTPRWSGYQTQTVAE